MTGPVGKGINAGLGLAALCSVLCWVLALLCVALQNSGVLSGRDEDCYKLGSAAEVLIMVLAVYYGFRVAQDARRRAGRIRRR
ncbi:hypothetical protein [Amycolatopsis sp. H20-H5]|uniref:hypothetical protein n=1 Tax=Amycolatopsis sp. H20-H5 TaxID=3046309 RepID=UPI002DBBB181|nr:hypothetical protein [Amycolatopsis sp. H20-H5]MEC3977758.1 hypothetical protein [Amycolatopsis sp. H20-H5]